MCTAWLNLVDSFACFVLWFAGAFYQLCFGKVGRRMELVLKMSQQRSPSHQGEIMVFIWTGSIFEEQENSIKKTNFDGQTYLLGTYFHCHFRLLHCCVPSFPHCFLRKWTGGSNRGSGSSCTGGLLCWLSSCSSAKTTFQEDKNPQLETFQPGFFEIWNSFCLGQKKPKLPWNFFPCSISETSH